MAGHPVDRDMHASLTAQLHEPGLWDDAWLERLMARHFDDTEPGGPRQAAPVAGHTPGDCVL